MPTPAFIQRRIECLLREARQEDAQYDLSVVYTLRAVWNYYAIGDARAGSNKLKLRGQYRSRLAHALWHEITFDEWRKTVIYEHEMPLKHVWRLMQNEELVWEDVENKMRQWLPVVVTRAEDDALRLLRDVPPSQRYGMVNIEVLTKSEDGQWLLRGPGPID